MPPMNLTMATSAARPGRAAKRLAETPQLRALP
jgi:hypothetical protein